MLLPRAKWSVRGTEGGGEMEDGELGARGLGGQVGGGPAEGTLAGWFSLAGTLVRGRMLLSRLSRFMKEEEDTGHWRLDDLRQSTDPL